MRNHFVAAQWLAGFLLLAGDVAAARAIALEALGLSRALGNVNLLDSLDQLAIIAAEQGDLGVAARLWGYADAYAKRYQISRYRISFAVRERLLKELAALTCEGRSRLMAEGAAWSEEEMAQAARTI